MTKRQLIIFLSILITCCVLAGAGLALVLVESYNVMDSPLDIVYNATTNFMFSDEYEVHNASEFSDIDIVDGTKVTDIPLPQVADYYFAGWYLDSNLTTAAPMEFTSKIEVLYPKFIASTVSDNLVYNSTYKYYILSNQSTDIAIKYSGTVAVIPDYSNIRGTFAPVKSASVKITSSSATFLPVNTTEVYIGYNFTNLPNCFANSCTNLKSVYSYKSVYENYNGAKAIVGTVGDYAFNGCTKLTTFEPVLYGNVGIQGFYNCTNLNYVSFVSALNFGKECFSKSGINSDCVDLIMRLYQEGAYINWGTYVFRDCPNITSVTLYNKIYLAYALFEDCDNLTTIYIDKNTTSLYRVTGSDTFNPGQAFNWCSNLNTIIIEEGNTTYYVENGCLINRKTMILEFAVNSNSVVIPYNINEIAAFAFYGRDNIIFMTIPGSCTYVGENCFTLCSNLSSVVVQGTICATCHDFLACYLTYGTDAFPWNTTVTWPEDNHSHVYFSIPEDVTVYNSVNLQPVGLSKDDYTNNLIIEEDLLVRYKPQASDYYFDGWYLDSDYTTSAKGLYHYGKDGDITLYLKFKQSNVSDYLNYDSSNGYYVLESTSQISLTNNSTELVIPDYSVVDGVFAPVSYIADYTAVDNKGMVPDTVTNIYLSDNIEHIGNYFAYNNTTLQTVEHFTYKYNGYINVAVILSTDIGESAFEGCGNLTSVNLWMDGSIYAKAFYNCLQLGDTIASPGLNVVYDYAFAGTGVTLLNSDGTGLSNFARNISMHGIYVFASCPNITKLYINEIQYGTQYFPHGAFANCINLATIVVDKRKATEMGPIGQSIYGSYVYNIELKGDYYSSKDNPVRFEVIDGCLVDTIDHKLIYASLGIKQTSHNNPWDSAHVGDIEAYAFYCNTSLGSNFYLQGNTHYIGEAAFHGIGSSTVLHFMGAVTYCTKCGSEINDASCIVDPYEGITDWHDDSTTVNIYNVNYNIHLC